ncbi:MAG: peptidylprolyl isomerase [Candidatus Omnitrophica bacterium]|nr:peptidylprolyl isomerase [Candidatus Omnitrophota bacterium]
MRSTSLKNYFTVFGTFAVFCLLIQVSGCAKKPPERDIIARIGKDIVTVEDFNDRVRHLPESYRELALKKKDKFVQGIVNDTLLFREALKKGLDRDKDVLKTIEAAKVKILIARYLNDNVEDAIQIGEDEILKEYEDNKKLYMTPEVLRVSNILVGTRHEAEEILAELTRGASFEELARNKSMDPTAQSGGDIGYFPVGQLIPEFENACKSLQLDEISGIVRTKLGYHIVKLTDRKSPIEKPLDEVKENIRTSLSKKHKQVKFNDLLKQLRENAGIKINEEALAKAGEVTNESKK